MLNDVNAQLSTLANVANLYNHFNANGLRRSNTSLFGAADASAPPLPPGFADVALLEQLKQETTKKLAGHYALKARCEAFLKGDRIPTLRALLGNLDQQQQQQQSQTLSGASGSGSARRPSSASSSSSPSNNNNGSSTGDVVASSLVTGALAGTITAAIVAAFVGPKK